MCFTRQSIALVLILLFSFNNVRADEKFYAETPLSPAAGLFFKSDGNEENASVYYFSTAALSDKDVTEICKKVDLAITKGKSVLIDRVGERVESENYKKLFKCLQIASVAQGDMFLVRRGANANYVYQIFKRQVNSDREFIKVYSKFKSIR
ncbi:hypothetical protein [Burkholderia diffusa]|uniref:hypothetical protein n=1 Tax=Burkholderia diffusa TaxID=488732 RepID=UPI00157B6A75|nr:hypothetical protein [Burkholderia diffusa]NTY41672.1 hypothetical protein [Burkholderia diffusa]